MESAKGDYRPVYQRLYSLSVIYRLLNPTVTNYVTLECATKDMVMDTYNSGAHYRDLVFDLLELWFPSLFRGADKMGKSWSHFWDLDLQVETVLREMWGFGPDDDSDDDREDVPDFI
jgi:hypothetical protein